MEHRYEDWMGISSQEPKIYPSLNVKAWWALQTACLTRTSKIKQGPGSGVLWFPFLRRSTVKLNPRSNRVDTVDATFCQTRALIEEKHCIAHFLNQKNWHFGIFMEHIRILSCRGWFPSAIIGIDPKHWIKGVVAMPWLTLGGQNQWSSWTTLGMTLSQPSCQERICRDSRFQFRSIAGKGTHMTLRKTISWEQKEITQKSTKVSRNVDAVFVYYMYVSFLTI